jgi:hypothetical protein
MMSAELDVGVGALSRRSSIRHSSLSIITAKEGRSAAYNSTTMESIPRLSLLARPALLGLCYRALAEDADGGEAPLTLRRIEQVQAQLTLLLQRQSELKARQGIAAEHAAKARRSASQAQLDLRIFHETYEPPKRGFLRRLTPREREQERRLAELEAIAEHESEQATRLAEEQQLVTSELLLAEGELKDAREEREGLLHRFEEQLSAHVLELVSQGRMDEARDVLETARRDVRGRVVVGALLVLSELFATEDLQPLTARRMLDSLEPLFSQQPDASARALALLLKLVEGQYVTQAELGLLVPGNFRGAAMYRLYQLVVVLAGGGVDQQESGPWAGTLRLCIYAGAAGSLPAYAPEGKSAISTQSNGEITHSLSGQAVRSPNTDDLLSAFDSGDLVRMVLAAAVLLGGGELEQLWDTEWAEDLPERGSLIEHFSEPVPAWPVGLVTPWAAALSCLTLLAQYMAEGGRGGRFGRWLEDSYGWPKDDLYWWTLATLRDDPALLKNLRGGRGQLFTITDSSPKTN